MHFLFSLPKILILRLCPAAGVPDTRRNPNMPKGRPRGQGADDDDDDDAHGGSSKKKPHRFRSVEIPFDARARAEYLTGFVKRKNERRLKAAEIQVEKEKADRKKEKNERRQ